MKRFIQILSLVALLIASKTSFSDDFTWDGFYDSKSYFLTDEFSKNISGYQEAEKDSAVLKLKEALESPDVEIRRRAALTLGKLGDNSGVETMIHDMEHVQDSVHRNNIVVALSILNDSRAVPVLRKATNDDSPYVRGIALMALGELKAAEAFGDIVLRLSDMESRFNDTGGECSLVYPPVAFDAICALGALGEKRGVPILLNLFDDPKYQEEWLKSAVIYSLEKLTNQTFGENIESWKSWWQQEQRKD